MLRCGKVSIKLNTRVTEEWTIERIVTEYPPSGWEEVFSEAKEELKHVSQIIQEDEATHGRCIPLKKDLFNAFRVTPLKDVKVVIVGMDPYNNILCNGLPRAVGMSFSVSKEDTIPISLQNIYKELISTVEGFKVPQHGDLTAWAKQGVLMLNASLTVRPGAAGSHGKIWHGLLDKVIKAIMVTNPRCIWVLWGRDAQCLQEMLGAKFTILTAAHPSGFSANKGFFGCNHFNLINEELTKLDEIPINWNLD